MIWLHRHTFRKAFASVMVLFFFSSQAFSCCLVNREMGDYLKASLAKILPVNAGHGPHDCCPSKHSPIPPHPGHDDSESNGCCIQDANSETPQIASEANLQPLLPVLMLDLLHSEFGSHPRTIIVRAPNFSISDPPLYLTHLQLLI